jgi:hypothetical protein
VNGHGRHEADFHVRVFEECVARIGDGRPCGFGLEGAKRGPRRASPVAPMAASRWNGNGQA